MFQTNHTSCPVEALTKMEWRMKLSVPRKLTVFWVSAAPWMLMYFFAGFWKISPCVWLNSGFWCCVFLSQTKRERARVLATNAKNQFDLDTGNFFSLFLSFVGCQHWEQEEYCAYLFVDQNFTSVHFHTHTHSRP